MREWDSAEQMLDHVKRQDMDVVQVPQLAVHVELPHQKLLCAFCIQGIIAAGQRIATWTRFGVKKRRFKGLLWHPTSVIFLGFVQLHCCWQWVFRICLSAHGSGISLPLMDICFCVLPRWPISCHNWLPGSEHKEGNTATVWLLMPSKGDQLGCRH